MFVNNVMRVFNNNAEHVTGGMMKQHKEELHNLRFSVGA
jgi:hypothetical protein